jgi:hypothetical protein
MGGWNQPASFPEVIETHEYSLALRALAGSGAGLPRLDDQLRFVIEAISQHAEWFPVIPGTILRRVKTVEWAFAPPLVIYFSIDGPERRILRWIERDVPPQAEA